MSSEHTSTDELILVLAHSPSVVALCILSKLDTRMKLFFQPLSFALYRHYLHLNDCCLPMQLAASFLVVIRDISRQIVVINVSHTFFGCLLICCTSDSTSLFPLFFDSVHTFVFSTERERTRRTRKKRVRMPSTT